MAEDRSRESWTTVAFGDVAQLSKQRSQDPEAEGFERYVGLEHLDPGELKVRRWGTVADGTTFTSVFGPGQVLFGKRRAYQRKVAVADFSGVCSGDIYVFEPKDDRLHPELLPFICQTGSFFDHAITTSAGSLSPRTKWESLAEYEFALPPLEEQRRIVGDLSSAETAIEKLNEVVRVVAVTEMAVYQELLEAAVPTQVPLGDLLVAKPRNGCSAPEALEPTGHWVLSLSAITPTGYMPDQLKAVRPTPEMLAARLQHGDLLISRSNTRELVGLPAVFEEDREDVSRPDTMMLLRPDTARIRTRFLELFLRSPSGRRQIQSYAAGTSASMKKVNGRNVQKVRVPVPEEPAQLEIEEATSALRRTRSLTLQHLQRARLIKTALLNEVAVA